MTIPSNIKREPVKNHGVMDSPFIIIIIIYCVCVCVCVFKNRNDNRMAVWCSVVWLFEYIRQTTGSGLFLVISESDYNLRFRFFGEQIQIKEPAISIPLKNRKFTAKKQQ